MSAGSRFASSTRCRRDEPALQHASSTPRRPAATARAAPLDPGDGPRRDRDHYVLKADLPGLAEDDIKIEVEDNVLTVSGERKAEHEDKREGFYRVERASGAFRRSLTLPEGVDADGVAARFDKGVLEVRIPKPEERKPRRVAIQVGDAAAVEGDEAA